VVGVAQLIVVQLDKPGNGILYSLLLWVLQNILICQRQKGKWARRYVPGFGGCLIFVSRWLWTGT
jgi:hypothetical protein